MNTTPKNLEQILAIQDLLRPRHTGIPLIRIGGDSDGAYLIPQDLEGIAACFSPGCFNTKRFEDQLLENFGIRSHLCDFTSDRDNFSTKFREGSQTFEKKWLKPTEAKDSISLEEWVNKYESGHDDLLLQMDIEGAEFENLSENPEVLSRFRIIVVEFHISEKILFDESANHLVIQTIENLGRQFICVHTHANNCCGDYPIADTGIRFPRVFECTFLRKDRIPGSRESLPYTSLPNQLDILANAIDSPPLLLGRKWGTENANSESVTRMIDMVIAHSEHFKQSQEKRVNELEKELQSVRRTLGDLRFFILAWKKLKKFFLFFAR